MTISTTRTLLWFRRQLRTHDQPLFERIDPDHELVTGVWILDPREHFAEIDGVARTGAHRMRFLLESVTALRDSLQNLGSELIIRVGEPETILPELMTSIEADRLCFVQEPGSEERTVEKRVMDRSIGRVTSLGLDTLLEIDDPGSFASDLPEVFSKFRRTAEKKMANARSRPTPAALRGIPLPETFDRGEIDPSGLGIDESGTDPRAVMAFEGGEVHGLERVRKWIHEGDHLKSYKETRNGLLGEAYSSKFSPWLATGALSSRTVSEETFTYEEERLANESTYWMRFELLWREFFRLHLMKHGAKLFHRAGPAGIPITYRNDPDHFESWKSGTTGIPFVDANMRELSATGFMSNRGRQIVASFLSKNLDIDWRWGARWFEHCLIDYCPAANWGNWAYAAGVGADPRGFRGFDVMKQARNYDPKGEYVAHWLPEELSNHRGMARHMPWKHGGPRPIVMPEESLDQARTRWERAATRRDEQRIF